VRIFNEKEVDEIIVLDIDATVENRAPNFIMIENLAAECRMPLCYGGGIKTEKQAKRIVSLGVEKIAISSAAVADPNIIPKLANAVGSQSVVLVLDLKKNVFGSYSTYTHNGQNKVAQDPIQFAKAMEVAGIGELVINSIDQDGAMSGYDLQIARKMREALKLPMTILGGAGSLNDIQQLINEFQVIGASAGSLFVFKGKYRAVLINYPSSANEKPALTL
jgi:cyclase